MKKQTKTVLILAAVLVVLFGVYFVLFNGSESTDDSETVIRSEKLENIASVVIENEGGTFTFSHDGDTWTYLEDTTFPVNSAFLESMEKGVTEVRAKRRVKKDLTDKAEFGLDKPQSIVTVKLNDGSSFHIYVGAENQTTTDYYIVCDGVDGIYSTKDTYARRFCRTILDMASKKLIPDVDIAEVSSIKAQTPDESFDVVYVEDGASVYYTDKVNRFVLADGKYYSSSDKLAKALKDAIVNLSLDQCIAYKPTEQQLAEYGLKDPRRCFELTYKDGGQECTSVIKIGNEMTLQNKEGISVKNTVVYFEKEDIVFISNNENMAELMDMSIATLRSPRVSKVEFEEIDAIDLSTPQEKHTIELVRSTDKDLQGDDMTVVSYKLDGTAVEDDLWDITYVINSMNADSFPDQEVEVPEEADAEIVFTRNSCGDTTVTIRYYKFDNNFYLVEVDGYEGFLVNRKDVENLIVQIENY
ncbi:MAG: DUF4340 domain-containing protein [Lachnospiraceae bacterium]|nr:DUF4340 domain-containing protein [Candidatus Equihabitans merdae]